MLQERRLSPAVAPVVFCVFGAIAAAAPAQGQAPARIEGELRLWHKVTLTFEGPRTSENATPNPFRHYRLNVRFRHAASGKTYWIPGYYAADGRAGESSAAAGNRWRAHFAPDEEGEWKYLASFRAGEDVAVSLDPEAGEPAAFDSAAGSFQVRATNKTARDHRAKGLLRYIGQHYLRFAGTGEYYLKGGADSPENFLAYADFDGTFDTDADSGSYKKVGRFIHNYEPHVKDWRPGDPAWQGGKGKGIVGALNYLAAKGGNSVYFLTYNLDGGDGRDTWMWTAPDVRDRFDVSKLDQWEIVFTHMDANGIMLHVVTQETENDAALGGGPGLNPIRKLYYRELCARFSHHLAVVWNLGEENNTSDPDRKDIARFIRALDPYRHPITVHTKNRTALRFYDGLLGDPHFEATSIQGQMEQCNLEAVELRKRSAAAGRKWVVFHDEQGPASIGAAPDAIDPDHDVPRTRALWGNLMGGGGGVEWYFGSSYPHMDINCEDWRSRDALWDMTRYALEFFHKHLPFWEMEPRNELATGVEEAFVLARGESLMAVYLPSGGSATVTLGNGSYSILWFDPRNGGELQAGTVQSAKGPGPRVIGLPPAAGGKDWVALVRRR